MYHDEKRGWMKHLDFTLLDIASLLLSLVIAYAWRFGGELLFTNSLYVWLFFVVIFIDIGVVFFAESYSGILMRTRYQEATATFIHVFLNFGVLQSLLFATKQSALYSRQMLFCFFGVALVLEYACRVIRKRQIRKKMLADRGKTVMLVVAESETVEQCLSEIAHDKYADFSVEGVVIVDEDRTGERVQGIPVVASADTFMEYVRTSVVDEIFIDGNTRASSEALAEQLVELGLVVHISLVHTDKMIPNRKIEGYANYVVLTTSMKIANMRQVVMKRALDIIGGAVGMLFTAVFAIIFGPIIKWQSPGPVFYRSIRIGRGGRRFTFYKFRTMVVDADKQLAALQDQNQMQGNMFKMDDDPRIIPIGHFMRKYSIDEFPQFWNVLKGDMSLVGTRPPTEEEFARYEYHHKARLGIKPGLTGMWQTSGRSEITDFEEVVALDTEYIMNWTLGLDAIILLKTVRVVLSGHGSK